jgi:hypothetical protein
MAKDVAQAVRQGHSALRQTFRSELDGQFANAFEA